MENRIKSVQENFKQDNVAALKHIEKSDKERREYMKKNFNKNIDDPSLYTMILNLDRLSAANATKLIAEEIFRNYVK